MSIEGPLKFRIMDSEGVEPLDNITKREVLDVLPIEDWVYLDLETNRLRWKKSPNNRVAKDSFCGGVSKTTGYLYVNISYNGKAYSYYQHSVIWRLRFGYYPEDCLDHINGDKLDNRIENLREVSHSQNMKNLKTRGDSKTGFRGVSQMKNGRYRAYITTDRVTRHIGCYGCKTAAALAYDIESLKYHKEFGRRNL